MWSRSRAPARPGCLRRAPCPGASLTKQFLLCETRVEDVKKHKHYLTYPAGHRKLMMRFCFPSPGGVRMPELSTSVRQAAAIPIRGGKVCLVTSRSGKRWVIPKGCMEQGKSAGEVALQEAWEEAGLVGVLHPEPVGSYLYDKYGSTHHVTVFVLEVAEVAESWPEQALRTRSWLPLSQALARLEDPGLRKIVRTVVGGDLLKARN